MTPSDRTGRHPVRTVARLLAVPAVLAGLAGFAVPTATAGPSPSPSPTADDVPVTLTLDQVSPQVVQLGQDVTVTVTVTNTGDRTLEDGALTLAVGRYRLATRSDLDGWLAGTTASSPSTLVQVELPAPLAAGAATRVDLVAPEALLRLSNVWGPRGLLVRFSGDGERTTLRTFLLWQSTEKIPTAQVALVAPVVGPADTSTLPALATSSEPSPTATAQPTEDLRALVTGSGRLAALTRTATAVPELGLAVDPALLARAAASGDADVVAWAHGLQNLLGDGRDAIALPWADPDLTALADADDSTLLQTARDAATAAQPGLSGDLVWASDAVDTDAARTARAAGATRLLVTSTEPYVSGAVATARTPAGDVTLLRADDQLDGLLTDGPTTSVAAAQQQALAVLAVAARDDGGGSRVLVAAGRAWAADPARTRAFVSALRAAPWVHLVGTADLATTGDRQTVTLPTSAGRTADVLAAATVQALADARSDLRTFARATREPAMVTAGLDAAVLAPLAVAWRADPGGRTTLVDATQAAVRARRSALSLAPKTNLTVISTSSDVRFVVHNNLPVAATVRVQVEPAKACLAPVTSAAVTVAAATDTSVPVTFTARANCEVKVRAWLAAADGTRISQTPLELTARLSPTTENVGTVVVGGLLALGLAVGLLRTVRRGQSGRRGARTVDDAEPVLPVLGGEPETGTGGPRAGAP